MHCKIQLFAHERRKVTLNFFSFKGASSTEAARVLDPDSVELLFRYAGLARRFCFAVNVVNVVGHRDSQAMLLILPP